MKPEEENMTKYQRKNGKKITVMRQWVFGKHPICQTSAMSCIRK